MGHIEVSDDTYRDLELLAASWQTTVGEAVARLIDTFTTASTPAGETADASPLVAVHAVYAGTRTEATFDSRTRVVTITSGPLSGRSFTSPSGARAAVVRLLNPSVSPIGNGWDFWVITDTGARLHTLRQR